ncbi:Phenylacetate-coenzyme A ligase PaaK, adenylate-forming domain family [Streptomyces sp. Ag82_O1-12]|uniref:AMP-binding protein n=1 Tax=unclassified Streptomyces TaxID=2593676 RepID=UPI000BCBDE4A|nr:MULTISPECIES: AMP-binding protein [unclassified Streptomyces]SMQ21645.1 Phenylacetate-coenzyme A ligase PaaK, adenylate-forming domain family [Streptomyces sp. Ag82_O1-12]SOD50093.1 Phenylacetate-coenzyme A ligase PaaK, adenylate-forming domain family [Streptomyces sp. Ag82_G6-1]
MTTTTSLATHYEQFLELLSRDPRTVADGRDTLRARYGERVDPSGGSQPVVLTRDEWIRNQIDLTLALGRLLTEDDAVVSAVPYELSFIGAEVDRAIEMVGASVISVGTSGTICPMPRLLGLIEQYEVTALVCSPSFAAELAALAVSLGKRPADSTIRTIVCVGEACSTERLDRIGAAWAARTSALYGTPSTPTVAVACDHGALHLCDHRLRAEARGGLRGELILNGTPTGEVVELWPAEGRCDCGSPSRVLVPLGSVASAVRGPDGLVSAVDVERIVFGHRRLAPHFACAVRDGTFHVTCAVADTDAVDTDAMRRAIRGGIDEALGVDAEVTIVGVKDWSTAPS